MHLFVGEKKKEVGYCQHFSHLLYIWFLLLVSLFPAALSLYTLAPYGCGIRRGLGREGRVRVKRNERYFFPVYNTV